VCNGKIKALEEENAGENGQETSRIAVGRRRHQKCEPSLTAGHSITSYLAKRHNGFLKHNINIFNVLILCLLKAAQITQERIESHNWPASCRIFTTDLKIFSFCTF
jgi:hypothetical protein